MRAGQRLVAADGYEVALFPLVALYDYQDEGVGSHINTYNIDFHGYAFNLGTRQWERQYNAPLYAPCTCKLVYVYPSGTSGGHGRCFQSVNPVHTPGGLRYIMFFFGHDPNPPYSTVGQVVNQGDLIYHTGTYGIATGDHVHTGAGEGQWISWSQSYTTRPGGHEDLTNHIHYWEAFYVNDTEILEGKGHNWQVWTGPTPPGPTPGYVSFNNFPWVLYSRKFRRERS